MHTLAFALLFLPEPLGLPRPRLAGEGPSFSLFSAGARPRFLEGDSCNTHSNELLVL